MTRGRQLLRASGRLAGLYSTRLCRASSRPGTQRSATPCLGRRGILMTNSLFSSAALVAVVLCGAPLLAQQASEATSSAAPPDTPVTSAAQPATASPGVRIVRLSQATGEVQLD